MLKTNSPFLLPPANLLGDMPIGTILKDTRTTYGNSPILWRIAGINHPEYPEDSVTLISYRIIACKAFDAWEPRHPTTKCRTKGCARYIWSNIRRWSNSDAPAGEWYTPQHEYDEPPITGNLDSGHNPYLEEAGFLSGFSAKFAASVMPTTLKVLSPEVYGGGFDIFTDKIFLLSLAEIGCENYMEIDEGSKLGLFSNISSKVAYPTQYCVESSTYQGSDLSVSLGFPWMTRSPYGTDAYTTFFINSSGTEPYFWPSHPKSGFRPACNLPAETRVSIKADTDGAYLLFA